MAEGDRERELRDELARLDVEMADGERNANDIASKAQRRAEIAAEMERLGISVNPDAHKATTYYEPP